MDDITQFFERKKSWSRYKDGILDYYLKPYLAKVALRRKPILIVDCFAGRGRFEDGEPGSPLIIAKHLSNAQNTGATVSAIFVEAEESLYPHLVRNLAALDFPYETVQGDIRHQIKKITSYTATHSVFLYIDPFRPSNFELDIFRPVFNATRHGHSVESLINFPSLGFLRRARALGVRLRMNERSEDLNASIARCSAVVGSDSWVQVARVKSLSNSDEADAYVACFADNLAPCFNWLLHYPIRAEYKHTLARYHLVFGSRHPDAVDLMNRAMVNARREFVGARIQDGFLFDNQPAEEVVDIGRCASLVCESIMKAGRCTWQMARVLTTIAYPSVYTDSELNKGIKQAISTGRLRSTATGRRIEDDAEVWMP